MMDPSKIKLAQNAVLRWYRQNGRSLPWRRTRNPYKILISEIMLQQTQVSRVREHFHAFLREFPGIRVLASSSRPAVLRAWRGMGYNNRAIRLRALAQKVLEEHKGKIPRDIDRLRGLPGIGNYTAHAIACFAYGKEVPVVDTNVARVLTRLFPSRADIWDLAERVLPRGRAYEWNQALMDLGALICTSSSPDCAICPLRAICPSSFRASRLVKNPKKPEPGRDGVPNRIYRGRIVEVLRNRNGSGRILLDELGELIKQGYSRRDRTWLEQLLSGLERDGIVRVRGKRGRQVVSFAR